MEGVGGRVGEECCVEGGRGGEEYCVEGGSGRGREECCGEGVGGREISVHAIRGGGRARDEYKRQEAEGSNAGTGDTRLCEDKGHLSRAAAPLTVAYAAYCTYRMGLNFRRTKLPQFSRFGGHPRIV